MMQKNVLHFILGGGICFVFWTAAAHFLKMPVIPPPEQVMVRLSQIFLDTIAVHGAYSFMRLSIGLLMAVLIGYPVGVMMGYFGHINRVLSPIIYLTYPIPKIALLPVVMLLFGVGELSKLLLVFFILVFQIIVTVRDAVAGIPPETYVPLRVLGASFGQMMRHVILPASLPKFVTAVRVAMATAISVLFFTETFGTRYGIGYFIMDAWLRVNYLDMYAGIVVLSAIGLLFFAVFDGLERKLCRWH